MSLLNFNFLNRKAVSEVQQQWWNLTNKDSSVNADLFIDGAIVTSAHWDDESGAVEIVRAISNTKKPLSVYINSPGGSVTAGLAIYHALTRHKNKGYAVNTFCTGIAASIASLVFLAGEKRYAPINTMVMIHNPLSVAFGESKDMRKAAEVLDTVKQGLINTYVAHTGLTETDLIKMMDEETWMLGDEAKNYGFATDIDTVPVPEENLKNIDLSPFGFRHAPDILNTATLGETRMNTTTTPPVASADSLTATNVKTMIDNALKEQREAFQTQLDAVRNEYAEKDAAERARTEGINNLFALFGTPLDAPFKAHYDNLHAQLLSDRKYTVDDARAQIQELRSKFSTAPAMGSAASGTAFEPDLSNQDESPIAWFDNKVSQVASEKGITEGAAVSEVVDTYPAQYQAYLKALKGV